MMSENKNISKIDIMKESKIIKYLVSTGVKKIVRTHKREYSIYIPYDESELKKRVN